MIEIKKYANRRLYDTTQSAYITLADLAMMVQNGHHVNISDAKTGADLTQSTLLQILSERHAQQGGALSVEVLSALIAYDNDETGIALAAHLNEAIAQFQAIQNGTMQDEGTKSADIEAVKKALLALNASFSRLKS